jgi:AraC family transcriptional activator of pobA
VHPEIYNEFPFLLAEIVPPKTLNDADFEELYTLYHQILQEFENDSAYKDRILGNLFLVFLLKIKEKFWLNYNPIEEGDRNSQIVKSFKQLLEREFKQMIESSETTSILQAQYFAQQLNLHPNYLNSVIKSKTGTTVNEWIAQRTLSLAKHLLLSSSLSSKEIAYKLGFSEPTHFGRFFKKHTKLSPSAFRKSSIS